VTITTSAQRARQYAICGLYNRDSSHRADARRLLKLTAQPWRTGSDQSDLVECRRATGVTGEAARGETGAGESLDISTCRESSIKLAPVAVRHIRLGQLRSRALSRRTFVRGACRLYMMLIPCASWARARDSAQQQRSTSPINDDDVFSGVFTVLPCFHIAIDCMQLTAFLTLRLPCMLHTMASMSTASASRMPHAP